MAESTPTHADFLRSQAEVIRASDFLGRSALTRRLFDFLVERTAAGAETREIDIAVEVFGRRDAPDLAHDASVRVYVHRLRKRLEEFYDGPGRHEPMRLSMPRGTYRIEVQNAEPPTAADAPSQPNAWKMIAAGLGALCVVLAVFAASTFFSRARDDLAVVRAAAPWATMFADKRPIYIAVGDYYIFGETDETMNVQRLVREYAINSREGLYEFFMTNPEYLEKYVDLGLRYLPTSVAFAMNDVLTLLNSSDSTRNRVRIILASDLTAEIMKESDIVYIGYISGLGKLRDPVFAASRYSIGDTYDQIVDDTTAHKYFAGVTLKFPERGPTRDYGLASTFSGPNGNRFVIIAGTRDVAIRHTAKELTDPSGILKLLSQVKDEKSFEALYSVDAIDQTNMRGELTQAAPIANDNVWVVPSAKRFPTK